MGSPAGGGGGGGGSGAFVVSSSDRVLVVPRTPSVTAAPFSTPAYSWMVTDYDTSRRSPSPIKGSHPLGRAPPPRVSAFSPSSLRVLILVMVLALLALPMVALAAASFSSTLRPAVEIPVKRGLFGRLREGHRGEANLVSGSAGFMERVALRKLMRYRNERLLDDMNRAETADRRIGPLRALKKVVRFVEGRVLHVHHA